MNKKASVPVLFRKYNLPVMFPVIFFLGKNWTAPRENISFLHFHNCMEIGFCSDHPALLSVEGCSYPIPPSSFFLLPSYVPHITCSLSDDALASFEYLMLDPGLLFSSLVREQPHFFDRLSFSPTLFCPVFTKEEHPELVALAQSLFEEARKEEPFFELSMKGLFLIFFVRLMREIPSFAIPGEDFRQQLLPILPSIWYIQLHYAKELTIPELAAVCGFSATHYRRLFREYVHMSPLEYVTHVRINEACSLLLTTDLPVKDIALRTGFSSLSSFNRGFSSVLHLTPTAWKKRSLQTERHPRLESQESLANSPYIFL